MPESEIIGRDQIVSLDYRLTDERGELIDSSEEGEPLVYLHGHGQIIPGLEKALDGKPVGHAGRVVVDPVDGYGVSDPELVFVEPKASFGFDVEVGAMLEARDPDGESYEYQVVAVTDEGVTLDGNHPLAGKTLTFEVTVTGVRPASEEELAHGHAHGEGGHHH
jgi:FKBP-type peptidyl-prolyl cis-trans isomerase SlyD